MNYIIFIYLLYYIFEIIWYLSNKYFWTIRFRYILSKVQKYKEYIINLAECRGDMHSNLW